MGPDSGDSWASCRRANGWYSHAAAMLRTDDRERIGDVRAGYAAAAAEAARRDCGFEGT
jgi:hypothetical protein